MSINVGKRNNIGMFCACRYDQSQLSPKTFSRFHWSLLSHFEHSCQDGTLSSNVLSNQRKEKGFVSCSTLRAVHIIIHAHRSSSCPFHICRFCTKELIIYFVRVKHGLAYFFLRRCSGVDEEGGISGICRSFLW